MRVIPFIVSILITLALVFALDTKWGSIPPLGRFLSPQQGFWQNAEPSDHNFSQELSFTNLKGKVDVYFDERLVPHVFAEHDEDAFFVQGYLHAKFRLWQMEFQTFAAAGRISEKLGNDPRFIHFDREQRRLGMVWGAENALKELEANPLTKIAADSYTAGVNAFINSLSASELPVEYKLLDYRPEPWSNFKTALFLKQMSKTLAGHETDLENTNAKSIFSEAQMRVLYPQSWDSSKPIIPSGTEFPDPAARPVKPLTADRDYFNIDTAVVPVETNKPDPHNGSNNWALSGNKTESGFPILCNDPHLELTLPSIWYEMQISTPTMNAYGATFPGTFSVIIGYNDYIAFGFTNAQRDVKDYYEIRFRDDSKKEYWYNGQWQPTTIRIDTLRVRGAEDIYDTVAYCIWGPVIYEKSFTHELTGNRAIAVRWTAHDPSNEALMWLKLNRARNYYEYSEAIKTFTCPGQNMLFASKEGDIALWQQARFPARWEGQGMYLMPGHDSTYRWQDTIPQVENPHIINPEEGFIQSANQRPVDTSYPYFIPGNYIEARGITLYKRLQQMGPASVADMKRLQYDYFSSYAQDAVPFLLRYVDLTSLDSREKEFLELVRNWDHIAAPDSKGMTVFQSWWDSLESVVWSDDFAKAKGKVEWPDEETFLDLVLKDSALVFIDDVRTSQVESIQQQVTKALKLAAGPLKDEMPATGLLWWKHKQPAIKHLLRESVKPFGHYNLPLGGWGNTLNAIKSIHGPSWRMIVHLATPTEAFGVYPGGQSGNPGSRFYDNFIDTWAKGEYFTLWMMKSSEVNDQRVKWKMTFKKSI